MRVWTHQLGFCAGRALCAGLWVMLAACGGSGGSGAGAESGGTGPTGLIPAPGVPGATLHADATVLRPLNDGAVWVYRGMRTIPGQQPVSFDVSRKQRLSGSDVIEAEQRPWDESTSLTLRASGGVVRAVEKIDGLFAQPLELPSSELRSPVRVNEQITLADMRGLALADDLDGDRFPESMDLAAYSVVIGDEAVALPELGRSLLALRVDTTTLIRLKLTSRDQPEPVQSIVTSVWYAPRIGIVRERTVESATASTPQTVTDETLQFWKSTSGGMGLLPSERIVDPNVQGLSPGYLGYPVAVAAVGDRLFVLTTYGNSLADGAILSVLGPDRRVLHSVRHLGLNLEGSDSLSLLPLGTGVGIVLASYSGQVNSRDVQNLRLVRFDATAQRQADVELLSNSTLWSHAAASDGSTLWLSWVDPSVTPLSVQARRFDANGRASGPAVLLESDSLVTKARTSIAVRSGRALVSWGLEGTRGHRFSQALVDANGTSRSAPLAGWQFNSAFGLPARPPQPSLSDSLSLLIWQVPIVPEGPTSNLQPLRGVSLNSSAMPLRQAGVLIDAEVLGMAPHERGYGGALLDGDTLMYAQGGIDVLQPQEVIATPMIELRSWSPGTGILATTTPRIQRLRNTGATSDYWNDMQVRFVVPMSDRWLLVGNFGAFMTVAVFYR